MSLQIPEKNDLEENPIKADEVHTLEVIRVENGGWIVKLDGVSERSWGWDVWNGTHNINFFAVNCNAVISNISLTLN